MARILVVEDDADIAELIRRYLQKAGHQVDCLSSGRVVLAHMRHEVPDLLVLDLMLPELDGLMVCQALRGEPATAAVPIIMLTARADDRPAGTVTPVLPSAFFPFSLFPFPFSSAFPKVLASISSRDVP
jgi:DNA-binding response OmpR family regulator